MCSSGCWLGHMVQYSPWIESPQLFTIRFIETWSDQRVFGLSLIHINIISLIDQHNILDEIFVWVQGSHFIGPFLYEK